MTGWNLPPGCTDADVERAHGDVIPRCSFCNEQSEEIETVYLRGRRRPACSGCAVDVRADDLDALIDEPDEWESAVAALWCQTGSEQNVPDSPEDAAHLASLIHRYSGPLRQENSCLRSALDSSVNAEMRVLMVLVSDSIISQDRAREIAGMTHEEQREHWRREHKTALTEGVAKAVAPLVSMLESIKSQTKEEGTHAMASIALFDAKRGNG